MMRARLLLLVLPAWLASGCVDFSQSREAYCATAPAELRGYCHPDWPLLTVSTAGEGTGKVASAPASLDCPGRCEALFAPQAVTLTATADSGSAFLGWSGGGCSGTGECQVHLSADTHVVAQFAKPTLQVEIAGPGQGAVALSEPNQSCQAGRCSYTYTSGTTVRLTANPAGNSYFQGWTGDCADTSRICEVSVDKARAVVALFQPQVQNLVFVSSERVAGNLGGVAAYDAKCNALATAAGINNATGNAYVAWISTTGANGGARILGRGFALVDGTPFADAPPGQGAILNALRLDEMGRNVGVSEVWTATGPDGKLAAEGSCDGWTSSAGTSVARIGSTGGGPGIWTGTTGYVTPCDQTARIYCMMTARYAPLTAPTITGKRVYLSAYWQPSGGIDQAQAKCDQAKPAGMGTVKPMLALASPPTRASAVLDPAVTYFRPDGQVIGTGAQLARGNWRTGIWQLGDGTYVAGSTADFFWVGAGTFDTLPADANATCHDWTGGTASEPGTGVAGDARYVSGGYLFPLPCNNGQARLVCVEQ